MKNFKLLVVSTLVSLAISGCGDQQTQSNSTATQANSTSQASNTPKVSSNTPEVKKSSNRFRYTWLAGQEANSAGEDAMFDQNYYFVVDGSGSMNESSCEGGGLKIDVAKKAIAAYVKTLPDDVNVGLMAFDGTGVTERVALNKSNKDEFISALNRVQANSGTPLESAITLAYTSLKKQGSKQGAHGSYNMIVVTDGEAGIGEDPRDIVREIGINSPTNITTIGFCIGNSHSLNDPEFVHYYPAGSYESILAGLTEVQAEGENISDAEYVKSLDSLADLVH